MRLIDADKMRDDWLENGENEYVYDTNAVLESIDAQPTVDAGEVVHGRFILDREKDVIRCSACGFETPTMIPYVCDGKNWVPFFERKYCGNCGAKMDRKDDT